MGNTKTKINDQKLQQNFQEDTDYHGQIKISIKTETKEPIILSLQGTNSSQSQTIVNERVQSVGSHVTGSSSRTRSNVTISSNQTKVSNIPNIRINIIYDKTGSLGTQKPPSGQIDKKVKNIEQILDIQMIRQAKAVKLSNFSKQITTALHQIRKVQNIQELYLNHCGIKNQHMQKIILNLPKIKKLDLRYNYQLTCQGFQNQKFKKIKSLVLAWAPNALNDQIKQQIIKCLSHLKELKIDCQISFLILNRIITHIPKLERLSLKSLNHNHFLTKISQLNYLVALQSENMKQINDHLLIKYLHTSPNLQWNERLQQCAYINKVNKRAMRNAKLFKIFDNAQN